MRTRHSSAFVARAIRRRKSRICSSDGIASVKPGGAARRSGLEDPRGAPLRGSCSGFACPLVECGPGCEERGEGEGVFLSATNPLERSLDGSDSRAGRFRADGTAPILSTVEPGVAGETDSLGKGLGEPVVSSCLGEGFAGTDGSAFSLGTPPFAFVSQVGTALRLNDSWRERNPGGEILFSWAGEDSGVGKGAMERAAAATFGADLLEWRAPAGGR
jgi:hypothetical protein